MKTDAVFSADGSYTLADASGYFTVENDKLLTGETPDGLSAAYTLMELTDTKLALAAAGDDGTDYTFTRMQAAED